MAENQKYTMGSKLVDLEETPMKNPGPGQYELNASPNLNHKFQPKYKFGS
jgi:hypothetical protein